MLSPWFLLILITALVSGAVVCTVALLLWLQRRQAMFRDFGVFTLVLTGYGLSDGILTLLVSDPRFVLALGPLFLGLGFADIILTSLLVRTQVALACSLTGRTSGPWLNLLSWAPTAAAGILVALILADPVIWNLQSFMLIGKAFLLVLFATVAAVGVYFLVQWKRIHDQIFRRILAGTGILFLVFIPVWLLEIFGVIRVGGVYLFILFWDLSALVIAARAYFQPARNPGASASLDPSRLEAVAKRFDLTAREQEIAVLHAQSLTSREIGECLFISPKTVRNHISNIYAKTGVNQRRGLVQLLQ